MSTVDHVLRRPLQERGEHVSVRIQVEGATLHKWIHDSVAANKPYNQMATELISAKGNNNFDRPTAAKLPRAGCGDRWSGAGHHGPANGNVATTFLGMSHVNCVLCHNGKGHLDFAESVGQQDDQSAGVGNVRVMAHTWPRNLTLPVDPAATVPVRYNYWSLENTPRTTT